ncbi:MAG: histidine phosphatase family protein [Thermaerobacter sp.]|nr:histidine phosphatase family protein [Thermaerobacter sp.]
MAELYLIRHGQTAWNAERRTQGQMDVPLDATGLHQAQEVARAFRSVPLRRIYASPLQRAMQTAAPLAAMAGVAVQQDARLKERNWGVYQGTTREEAAMLHPDVEKMLRRSPRTARPPGGESFEDLCARIGPVLREIGAAGDGPVAVVCHGGTISAGLQVLLGVGGWPKTRFLIDNASVSLVELTSRGEVIAHFINRGGFSA